MIPEEAPTPAASGSPSVLVSCVGENRDDWFAKIRNLVLSLRLFGGSLAQARVVVNLVGDANPKFVDALAELDTEVRVVDAVDRRQPSANKLRMLELGNSYDFDVLLMLDCDVIIRGDLSDELATSVLRATPAGKSHLSDASWRKLYGDLGIVAPERRYTTAVTGKLTYPYFNTGVLVVPRDVCEPLDEHWRRQLSRVLDMAAVQPALSAFRKDQIPFACALASAGIDIDLLPLNLNLATTPRRVAPAYKDQWGPPFIFHYHRSIDAAGFLGPSPRQEINGYLDEFNRRRSEVLGIPYAGMASVSQTRQIRSSLRSLPGYWELKRGYRRARMLLERSRNGVDGRE